MLLQRLVEYARDTADEDPIPPFYQRKPVRWMLDIRADGTPLGGLQDLADTSDRATRFGVPRLVPAITRTVGVAPALAVDTPEYVFGWVSDGVKPERVAAQHAAFRELIDEWRNAEPDGPGGAIAAFYRGGHQVEQPAGWTRADLVAFRVDGVMACETDSAKRFWATVAGVRKGSGRSGLCLVCGKHRELLKTIPQQIPRRLLPGATQSASLVSVNEAVHGYELDKFLGHTPICADCALKFMGALDRLLSDSDHSVTLPGQNARLAWWIVGGSTYDPWGSLDQPNEHTARDMMGAPVKVGSTPDDLSTFCSVTVGGNVARVVVRDWVELPLPEVRANIESWYADHEIVDVWSGQVSRVSLVQLARATGRWQAGRGGENGSWAKFGASGEDRPPGVFYALLRTALLNRPLPPGLLAHVLHRVRIDGRVDQARAALVRLALRRPPYQREALMPTLDLDSPDPAYHCGRAFAVFDELQRAVFRVAEQPLNTSFSNRYLGRAIINPRAALIAGERTSQAWLRRLAGPLRRPRWAAAYQRRLDEVFAQIAERGGFPAQAMLVQQGNFILGYHHERAQMRAERIAASQHDKPTDLPPADHDDLEGADE
jgi:CRISPR-associated protein Csd1